MHNLQIIKCHTFYFTQPINSDRMLSLIFFFLTFFLNPISVVSLWLQFNHDLTKSNEE